MTRYRRPGVKPTIYVAPFSSWASLQSKVYYSGYYAGFHADPRLSILIVCWSIPGLNSYGQVASAVLNLLPNASFFEATESPRPNGFPFQTGAVILRSGSNMGISKAGLISYCSRFTQTTHRDYVFRIVRPRL
jgi:hypothetical protein